MSKGFFVGAGALVACFCAAPCARAWGCKGHQTVALIAEKHLTPEAQQLVEKLLGANPIDPTLNAGAAMPREISWWMLPRGRTMCAASGVMVLGITSTFREESTKAL